MTDRTIKVRAKVVPEKALHRLIASKTYEAERLESEFYSIVNEKGRKNTIDISDDGCYHLNGGKWEVVE